MVPTVEVGCRGFVGHSVCRVPRVIGVAGLERQKLVWSLGKEDEMSSLQLWGKRNSSIRKTVTSCV
jgi:hypothetical protein